MQANRLSLLTPAATMYRAMIMVRDRRGTDKEGLYCVGVVALVGVSWVDKRDSRLSCTRHGYGGAAVEEPRGMLELAAGTNSWG